MHVMTDLETVGVRPRSALLQIGAVAFEARSGGRILNDRVFNQYVDPASCIDLGMTADGSTLGWWLKQGQDARMRVSSALEDGRAVVLPVALERLTAWFHDVVGEPEGVWGHGACFDVSLLQLAYDLCGMKAPWDYRAPRDTRTLFSLIGGFPVVETTGFVLHDATDDSVLQAMAVQLALKQIRGS